MLLRLAEPEDAMDVARVHVRSWQQAYRGLLPDEYLDGLRAADRAARYDLANRDVLKPVSIVVIDERQICGFATIAPARDAELSGHGELCALYVDPEYWGQGVGCALMAAARAHLVEAGFRKAALWVMAGNARAERFYRIDQWMPDGSRRTDVVWGVTVEEIRYRREL
jgi:ribosomal protein S18 acetylase RimI-like enzyme